MNLFLVSCGTAPLTSDQCTNMNWRARGKQEALQGQTAKAYVENLKQCQKHGIKASEEDYVQGRSEGLELFCTSEVGETFGRQGQNYQHTCPDRLEKQFLKGYALGLREFKIVEKEKELREREEEIRKKEKEAENKAN